MAKLTKARSHHQEVKDAKSSHIQQPQPVALSAKGFDFQFPPPPHGAQTSISSPRVSARKVQEIPRSTSTAPTQHSQASSNWNGSNVSENSFSSSITQEEAKVRWDSDEQLKRISKELLRIQKWTLIFTLCAINGALIYVGWNYSSKVPWLFLVLLSSNTMLQGIMIICIIGHFIFTEVLFLVWKSTENIPETPEKMVWLLPCYNETLEELTKSIDSLVAQKNVDLHPKLILIVVDGDVKGVGMEKTTQKYLVEDILQDGNSISKPFENGYRARDGLFMPVNTQVGFHRGIPYVFIGKRYNQGKRDSLCFARSFLYHFRNRSTGVATIFNQELFDYMGSFFTQHGIDQVDYLAGMDADTKFDEYCIYEMIREIRKNPKVVGVCGHVCVDFDKKRLGIWSLYQSVEYSQTQGLRRMFQSRITGKVNCLPGCCQLIKVDESTFGDKVLREKFGYCPKPNDNMTRQIMGNYSEDSIHASIIFSLFPSVQTAQALRAKAYTLVPQSWPVFLSQRKRWALGSISNEFVMIFRPGIILVERLQSIIAVMTWAITPFIIAAVIELIVLIVRRGRELFKDYIFLGLMCVLFFRYVYSFCIGFWLPRGAVERLQYFVGYFVHFVMSPFINIIILGYSLFNSDDFKWGKTRQIVDSDSDNIHDRRDPII